MKVFLAGATGFIGRHIHESMQRGGFSVIPHGFSRNGELVELPAGADIVVNAAGRLGGSGYPDQMIRAANFDLPVRLAEKCALRGIPMIHLSTPGVCGLRPMGKETDEYSPGGVYEKTKAEAEIALLRILPEITILRPDFVFGTGDMHKFPLFRQVSRGWFPLVGMEGARTRPTDALDVAEAVVNAFPGGPLQGGIFNIGGPEILSVREIAAEIAGVLGKRLLCIPLPKIVFRTALRLGPLCPGALSESRYRLFGTDRFVDTAKASRAGFTPGHTFRQTAEAAVRWYGERGLL